MKKVVSIRIDESISKSMEILSKKTSLSKADIIELSLLDFLNKWNKGILKLPKMPNITEYATLVRLEKLRRIVSKKRNEFLSKNLMIARINRDIYKLISNNKGSRLTHDQLRELILEYLNIRLEEAEYYERNKSLIKEINEMKTIVDKGIGDMKHYIESKMQDVRFMKQIDLDHGTPKKKRKK